jgi:sugar transferase (PEP-CTERM system associated)
MIRVFRHYLPVSLLVLGFVELLILCGSMYVAVMVRFWGLSVDEIKLLATLQSVGPVYPIYPKALTFAVVTAIVMVAVGLYQRGSSRESWQYARLVASFIFAFAVVTIIFYAIPGLFLGRGVFGLTFVIAFSGILLARLLYNQWTGRKGLKRRVLVLGAGTRAAKVNALELEGNGRQGFQVVGYLPLQGGHHFIDKSKIIAKTESIYAIALKHNVDEIVVGVRDRRGGGLPVEEVLQCKIHGIPVVELSTFFERETGHVQLQSLNPSWIIFSDGFAQGSLRDITKRLFDICASGLLLVLTLPLMLITALLIPLESRGPVFYRQERVGQGGKTFMVLKFRSMRTDAEKNGKPQWAGKNDSRVTRIGAFIRKVRIDELPQILNVLKGEMSFVGPRPERPFFVEQLTQQIPYYSYRHNVKPGITGWAQICYPYGASVEDAIEKLQYDLYYTKNHSLFLDLIILFQTMQVILFGQGAR